MQDRLALVKHARPVVDPHVPPRDWHLGDDGLAGAARLVPRLAAVGVDVVVSSLEPKAMQTGRVLADGLGVTFQTGDGLHEHERATAGFLSEEVFEASVRDLFSRPEELAFGEETGAAAEARFSGALDALRRAHRGARLAVVSHGTVISLHLAARYGLDGFATWRQLGLPSYAVVEPRLRSVVEVVGEV